MTATITATVRRRNGRLTAKEAVEYERRFRALGWGQNETARKIRKNPGLFSRWLRGHLASARIRRRLEQTLDRAEAK